MFGFEIRTAFVVLLLAHCIIGYSLPHPSHNITTPEHSNSDAAKSSTDVNSHGSKLLQPVPLVADHLPQLISISTDHTHLDNFTKIVRLEDVLVIFDLNGLAARWPKIHHELKSECRHDMTEYFRGLQQHKMWAIKSKLIVQHRLNFAFVVCCCCCCCVSFYC